MVHRQATVEEMRKALFEALDAMTPEEHFQEMVDRGLINNEGQLTKIYGGEADPEPGCHPEIYAKRMAAKRAQSEQSTNGADGAH